MKSVVALLLLAVVVVTGQAVSFSKILDAEWFIFKAHHKKVYKSPIEEGYRMKIFLDNKRKIVEHNRRYEMKEVGYKLGMNKYGDMLHHEVINTLNGFNKSVSEVSEQSVGATFIEPANVELPTEVDWKKKVLSLQLRIKDNVDPAGHSLQPELWKDNILDKLAFWCH